MQDPNYIKKIKAETISHKDVLLQFFKQKKVGQRIIDDQYPVFILPWKFQAATCWAEKANDIQALQLQVPGGSTGSFNHRKSMHSDIFIW